MSGVVWAHSVSRPQESCRDVGTDPDRRGPEGACEGWRSGRLSETHGKGAGGVGDTGEGFTSHSSTFSSRTGVDLQFRGTKVRPDVDLSGKTRQGSWGSARAVVVPAGPATRAARTRRASRTRRSTVTPGPLWPLDAVESDGSSAQSSPAPL